MTNTEKPIIFKSEMVKEILSGHKTQTRRTIKFKPPFDHSSSWPFVSKFPDGWWVWTDFDPTEKDLAILRQNGNGRPCPYGKPSERLWVRETWADVRGKGFDKDLFPIGVSYRAECDSESLRIAKEYGVKWKPSIFMPRWATRIILEITNVRVERLQEISVEDVEHEGIKRLYQGKCFVGWLGPFNGHEFPYAHASEAYAALWNSINGPGAWESNPWVWVISFKVV